MFISTDKF